jgi:hypothetical protein
MPIIPQIFQGVEDRPLVKVVYDSIQQPPAGQNLMLTVPQGYRLQLVSIFLTVVTDANIVNRTFFVQLTTAAGVVYYFQHPFIITNAETRALCIAPSLPLIPHSATNMSACWPWPADMVIEEGSNITIGLTAIQVGDQFTAAPYMILSQFVAE